MKGFVKLGESTIINDIRENLISYIDNALLFKENYISKSGTLTKFDDPRYSGDVYHIPNKNLVYESGFYTHSGIYINSTFYSIDNTTYPYYIDHINGRVIFTSKLPSNRTVSMNYTYKIVETTACDGLSWFGRIDTIGSGLIRENLIIPPAIGIEYVSGRSKPYQLGGGQILERVFLAHCISKDKYIADSIADMLLNQKDLRFRMYDLNSITTFPLDYRGVPYSGGLTFDYLVSNFSGRLLDIVNTEIDSVYRLGELSVNSIKLTTEVIHIGV